MRFALLPIFVVFSLTELTVLIVLSHYIGIGWTVAIVAGTALAGTAILRQQGLRALVHINKSMASGVAPVESLAEGFFIVLAGAFLLTPGIITDLIGFSLLVPAVRRRIVIWSLEKFLVKAAGHPQQQQQRTSPKEADVRQQEPKQTRRYGTGPVIEGEFERIDEKAHGSSKQQTD